MLYKPYKIKITVRIVLSALFGWMFDAIKNIFLFKYLCNCLRVQTGTQFCWWDKSYSPSIFKNLIQRDIIVNTKITYISANFIWLCSSLAAEDSHQLSYTQKKVITCLNTISCCWQIGTPNITVSEGSSGLVLKVISMLKGDAEVQVIVAIRTYLDHKWGLQ